MLRRCKAIRRCCRRQKPVVLNTDYHSELFSVTQGLDSALETTTKAAADIASLDPVSIPAKPMESTQGNEDSPDESKPGQDNPLDSDGEKTSQETPSLSTDMKVHPEESLNLTGEISVHGAIMPPAESREEKSDFHSPDESLADRDSPLTSREPMPDPKASDESVADRKNPAAAAESNLQLLQGDPLLVEEAQSGSIPSGGAMTDQDQQSLSSKPMLHSSSDSKSNAEELGKPQPSVSPGVETMIEKTKTEEFLEFDSAETEEMQGTRSGIPSLILKSSKTDTPRTSEMPADGGSTEEADERQKRFEAQISFEVKQHKKADASENEKGQVSESSTAAKNQQLEDRNVQEAKLVSASKDNPSRLDPVASESSEATTVASDRDSLSLYHKIFPHESQPLFFELTNEFQQTVGAAEASFLSSRKQPPEGRIELPQPVHDLEMITILCMYNVKTITDTEQITIDIGPDHLPFVKCAWRNELMSDVCLWSVQVRLSASSSNFLITTRSDEHGFFGKRQVTKSDGPRSLATTPFQYLFDVNCCTVKEKMSPVKKEYTPILFFDFILNSDPRELPLFFHHLSKFATSRMKTTSETILLLFRRCFEPVVHQCDEVLVFYAFAIIGVYDIPLSTFDTDKVLFSKMINKITPMFSALLQQNKGVEELVMQGLFYALKHVSDETVVYLGFAIELPYRSQLLRMMIKSQEVSIYPLILSHRVGLFSNYAKNDWTFLWNQKTSLKRALQLLEIQVYTSRKPKKAISLFNEYISSPDNIQLCKALIPALRSKNEQFLNCLKDGNAIVSAVQYVCDNPSKSESKLLNMYKDLFSTNITNWINVDKKVHQWYAEIVKPDGVTLKRVLEVGLPATVDIDAFASSFFKKTDEITARLISANENLAHCVPSEQFTVCSKAFAKYLATFEVIPSNVWMILEVVEKLTCQAFQADIIEAFSQKMNEECMKVIFEEKTNYPTKIIVHSFIAAKLNLRFLSPREIEQAGDEHISQTIYVPFEENTKQLQMIRYKWYQRSDMLDFSLTDYGHVKIWKIQVVNDKTVMKKFQLRRESSNYYSSSGTVEQSPYNNFIAYSEHPIRFVCTPPFKTQFEQANKFMHNAVAGYLILLSKDRESFPAQLEMLVAQLSPIKAPASFLAQKDLITETLNSLLLAINSFPEQTKQDLLVLIGLLGDVTDRQLQLPSEAFRGVALNMGRYMAEHVQQQCLKGLAKVMTLSLREQRPEWQDMINSLTEPQHVAAVLIEFFSNERNLIMDALRFLKRLVRAIRKEDVTKIVDIIFSKTNNFSMLLEIVTCEIAASIEPNHLIVSKLTNILNKIVFGIEEIETLVRLTREHSQGMIAALSKLPLAMPLKTFLNKCSTEIEIELCSALFFSFKSRSLSSYDWVAFKNKLINQKIRISTVLKSFPNESHFDDDIDLFVRWLSKLSTSSELKERLVLVDSELHELEGKASHQFLCQKAVDYFFASATVMECFSKAPMFDSLMTVRFREEFITWTQRQIEDYQKRDPNKTFSLSDKKRYPTSQTLNSILLFSLSKFRPLTASEVQSKLFSEPHLQDDWKVALIHFLTNSCSFVEQLLKAFTEIRVEIMTRAIVVERLRIITTFSAEMRESFLFYLQFRMEKDDMLLFEEELGKAITELKNLEMDFLSFNNFCSSFGEKLEGVSEYQEKAARFSKTFPKNPLKDCALPDFIEAFIPTVRKVLPVIRSRLFTSVIFTRSPLTCGNICAKCDEAYDEIASRMQSLVQNISTVSMKTVIQEFNIEGNIEGEIPLLKLIIPGFSSEFDQLQQSLLFHLDSLRIKSECEGLLSMTSVIGFSDQATVAAANAYLQYWSSLGQTSVVEYIRIHETVVTAIYEGGKEAARPCLAVMCKMKETSEVIEFLITKCTQEQIDQLKEGVTYYSESSVDLKGVMDLETLLCFYTEVKAEGTSFSTLVRKITSLTESERFKEIEKVMDRCKDILMNVKDVLVLMNNMEKAKQLQIVAIYENSSFIIVHIPDKGFDVKLKCQVSSILYELDVTNLSDLKDRALLTKYTSNDDSKVDEFRNYDLFCVLSDIILEIVATLNELCACGYPVETLYKDQTYACVKGQFDEVKRFKDRIDTTSRDWETILHNTYESNHLLTFFYGQQFWILEKHLMMQRSSQSSNLMEYIGLSGEPSCIAGHRNGVADRLKELGSALNALKREGKVLQFEEKAIPPSPMGDITSQPGSVLLTICSTTLHALVSVYLSTKRNFPQYYQVLFCSAKTTRPEILAFVYRFFTDSEANLYSLVSCENLDTENQVLFIELFDKLTSSAGRNSQLAVISNTTRGYIVDHFLRSKRVEVVRVKDGQRINTDDDLGRVVKSIDRNTFVYSSERAGLGKSTRIHLKARNAGKKLLKFSIAGDLDMDDICDQLLLKMENNVLLHINLGYVENFAGLNQFLMNLSLFRMVKSDDRIVCLPKDSIICIELPNLQPSLIESLPYLKLLHWEIVKFELNINIPQDIAQLFASYSELSSCCKSKSHSHLPNSNQAELLKCLFNQVCDKDSSFIRFRSFQNVLFALLTNFRESPFSEETVNEMIQDLKRGGAASSGNSATLIAEYKLIRKTIVESFLETTKEVTAKFAEGILQMQLAALSRDVSVPEVIAEYKSQSWDASNRFVMLFIGDGSMLPIYKKPKNVADDVIPTNIKKLIFLQTKSDEMTGRQMAMAIKGVFQIDYYEDFTSRKLCEKLFIYCSRPKNDSNPGECLNIEDKEYVLTPDNFLKMNLIYLRAMAKLPIVIMGETGCGKTSLIRFFVNNVLRDSFFMVSVHAGFDSKELAKKMKEIKNITSSGRIWVFFDEFNTSACVGQICEVMCERTFQGEPLPDHIVLLGACNPYRRRTVRDDEEVGIKKAQKYVNELANALVHVVKPLPETMIEYVWDFGALTDADSRKYMHAMLAQLGMTRHFELMLNMLFACQTHWKKLDPSSVSMRDVKRFTLLYKWFYESLGKRKQHISEEFQQNAARLKFDIDTEAVQDLELSAGILALCYCYYLRISKQEERGPFLEGMATASRDATGKDRITSEMIKRILKFNEDDLLARMKLPKGTALNIAFRENICTLLPCIYTGVAVFICGKPGCSKSLAVQVLFDNCKGRNSADPYFKSLRELIRVNFQGSESCTSKGVEKAFEKAETMLSADKDNHLPVVVFDEIGLAEISPHNPLKVLHSKLELENRDIAFIGISNWRLDASKMNRALYLARPEPKEEELHNTALSLFEAIYGAQHSQQHCAIIAALAEAYSDFRVMLKDTPFKEFYGLRDFYNLIKLTGRFFKAKPDLDCDDNAVLCKTAILRNFGGLMEVSKGGIDYSEVFYHILKKKYLPFDAIPDPLAFFSMMSDSFRTQRATALDLVQENMHDELSRYLMIISKDDVALFVLERVLQSLSSDKKVVVVGSHMPDDDAEEYGFSSLSNVLLHMETGVTMILKDMNHIYTALYDLFNQNFSRSGSRNYCRVAIGAQFNPRCYVHDEFRVIILMDDDISKLTQTDAPFLNRFEKQRFSLDLLVPPSSPLLSTLTDWVQRIMTPGDSNFTPVVTESQVFPLFTPDFLKLLVLFSDDSFPLDIQIRKCKEKLLKIATADLLILCKLSAFEKSEQLQMIEQWFQLHDLTFKDLIEYHRLQLADGLRKLVVFTFDNSTQFPSIKYEHKHFSLFHTEREFMFDIKTFLKSDNLLYILEINLDSSDSTHLTFIKFTIDNIVKEVTCEKMICLLVRLRRVAKRNVSLCWFESWEQITLENLSKPFANNLPALQSLLSARTVELIQNREFFDFENRIEAITQETYLKFELEFPPSFPKEKSSVYMLEVAEKLSKQSEVVQMLKDIVLSRITTEAYVVANWRMSVLHLAKCIEGPVDLESAIRVAIENEVMNAYTPIFYAIEQHFAFLSYFSEALKDAGQKEVLKEMWIAIVKELDFGFKLEGSNYNLCIEFQLDFPFSHCDYQLLNSLHNEYNLSLLSEKKEAGPGVSSETGQTQDNSESPEAIAEAEFQTSFCKYTVLTGKLTPINEDSALQRLYIHDLIRMDFLNHPLQSSLEAIHNALALAQPNDQPQPELWQRVLSFLKNRQFGKMVFEALKVLHSLGLVHSEGKVIPIGHDTEEMRDLLKETFDDFALKLVPTSTLLDAVTLQLYSASLESLFDIYVNLDQELVFDNFRIVEFWMQLSGMLGMFPTGQPVLQSIAEEANKVICTDALFVYDERFSDYVLTQVKELKQDPKSNPSQQEEGRFRFCCSYYAMLLDERADVISEIADKVITSDLWKYSAILMNKIIMKTGISELETFENPDDEVSDYLKHLEDALEEVGLHSRFAVLLSDSLYKQFPAQSSDMKKNFKESQVKFVELTEALLVPGQFPNCKKLNVIAQLNAFLGPYCFLLWKDKLLEDDINQLASKVDDFLCKDDPLINSLRLFCVKKTKQMSSKPNFYLWNLLLNRDSVGWIKKLAIQKDVGELWPVMKQSLYRDTREGILQILEGSEIGEFQPLFERVQSKGDQIQFILAVVTVLLEKNAIIVQIQNAEKWLNHSRQEIENKFGLPVFGLLSMLVKGIPDGSALKVMREVDYRLYPLYYFLVVLLVHRDRRHPMTSILFDTSGNIDLQRINTMHVYGVEDEPLFASIKYQLDNFDHFSREDGKVFKCSNCEFISIVEITSTKCKFCNSDMTTCKAAEARDLLRHSVEKYQATEPREGYSVKGFGENYVARPINIATLRVLHLLLNTTLLFVHHSKLVSGEEFSKLINVESVNEAITGDLFFFRKIIGDDTDASLWLLALLEDLPTLLEAHTSDFITHQQRALFEHAFNQKVGAAIASASSLILSLKKRFLGTDDMEMLVEETASPEQLAGYEHYQLLRICKTPSFDQVQSLFYCMDDARKSNLGLLNTYFVRQKHFEQLQCLSPLVKFTNMLLKQFSHKCARAEIAEKKIEELLGDEIFRESFAAFREVWNSKMQQPLEFKGQILPPKRFSENDEVLWFLVDSRDQGRLVAAALLYLAGLQNSLLSLFSKFLKYQKKQEVAYIDPVEYPVQSIESNMIVQVNLNDPEEMAKSYVHACKYGRGKQVLYDFDRFQRLMMKSMKKAKRLNCSSLQYIQFQFELQGDGLVSSVRQIVSPQMSFTHEIVKGILRGEVKNSTMLRTLYTSLGVVLYYIKLKRPTDCSIETFCKTSGILKISGIDRKLTEESEYSRIPLMQIVGFYELVEELYFPHFSTYVAQCYRERLGNLEEEVNATIERSKKLGSGLPPREAMLSAIRRLIIRCLPNNLNPKDLLRTYLQRKDLWDQQIDEKCIKNLEQEWRFFSLANAMQVYETLEKYERGAEADSQSQSVEGVLVASSKKVAKGRGTKKGGRRDITS